VKPPCEKNSCQELEYRTQLAEKSDFCEPCKEKSGWSVRYIKRHKNPTNSKDKSFIPKDGTVKAAVYKKQRLMQNIINGTARLLNRSSPTKARNEIYEQAEKMKVPLKSINEFGCAFDADTTPCEEQGAEVKENAGVTNLEEQTVKLPHGSK
jgi:hypothetical protein